MLQSPLDQWDETTFLGLVASPYAAVVGRVCHVWVRAWLPSGLTATVRSASEAVAKDEVPRGRSGSR
jgi:hypothetical protein